MRLEKRQHELIGSCIEISKKEAKYKEIIPLAQLFWDLQIGQSELISFKVAINEAAQIYGLTPSAAALRVINVVSDYNKKGQLEHELYNLSLQKYAINEFFSSHSQAIRALASLRNQGITEDRLIQLNNILENNEHKIAANTT
jgi:hypothetical protein